MQKSSRRLHLVDKKKEKGQKIFQTVIVETETGCIFQSASFPIRMLIFRKMAQIRIHGLYVDRKYVINYI